jgi:hypothetical protein
VLARDVEAFAGAGFRERGRRGELRTILERDRGIPVRLELVPTGGRVFGGAYALEVSTADPVLPPTGGIRARGRGIVRLERISFRPRVDDAGGRRVAERLGSDASLQRALREVHFEEIRVEPDGRAVIRHMGGSVVWLLFPPMARPIAMGPEQVRATIGGLEAFARAARGAGA